MRKEKSTFVLKKYVYMLSDIYLHITDAEKDCIHGLQWATEIYKYRQE